MVPQLFLKNKIKEDFFVFSSAVGGFKPLCFVLLKACILYLAVFLCFARIKHIQIPLFYVGYFTL